MLNQLFVSASLVLWMVLAIVRAVGVILKVIGRRRMMVDVVTALAGKETNAVIRVVLSDRERTNDHDDLEPPPLRFRLRSLDHEEADDERDDDMGGEDRRWAA